MPDTNESNWAPPLNVAIVGGGRACRFFLDLLRQNTFPHLKVQVVGVCDIDPEAEGFVMAREMGIPTTRNFRDFFGIPDLDGILELTNSNQVLMELIQLRPRRIGILEHNIGRLLRNLFTVEERLKSAERQVAHEKDISDFLIQETHQRVVVLNTDFTIAEANDAYLADVGKTRPEVIGQTCYRIMHGLDQPCSGTQMGFSCPMVETLRTGKPAQVIHESPASADRMTFSEIVTYPQRDTKTGEVSRVIEIWRDLTDAIADRWDRRVRELKADLNRLVQEDRMISLGKLVASCVHEVNNPIQGLLTFSRLMEMILEETPPDPEALAQLKTYAGLMTTELERTGRIISGLLSFSRESPMAYTHLNLNEVLETVVALIRHRLELQDVGLRLHLTSSPLLVKGDTNQLQQCFLNLMFNAVEATPPGGMVTVVSEASRDGRVARVTVQDTGHGIPDDQMDHIFDPFFTTKNAGEGTGLGLSIVYGIVKNHEGTILVDSRVGGGSTFELTFPLVPAGEETAGHT